MKIRNPAVSGAFYPAEAKELTALLQRFLKHAKPEPSAVERPSMLIVPHAGYLYSGQIAADAFSRLSAFEAQIQRVILLGPSHRVPLVGMAVPDVDCFNTPLGNMNLDVDAIQIIEGLNGVQVRNDAHASEHSLEVQIPFLQTLLPNRTLVPVVVGRCDSNDVSAVIHSIWDSHSLLVVSTDLSHFLYDADARRIDAHTIEKIEHGHTNVTGEEACGHYPLNGAMSFARTQGWSLRCITHGNSGDTTGDKTQVVGYASFSAIQQKAA